MEKYALYAICLGFGGAGAWFTAKWGKRLSLLDKANHRSSHEGVVPKGGGIGILAAFLFSAWLSDFSVFFWAPTTLVALVSLHGDRVELSPRIRLPIQFLAAFVILLFAFPGVPSLFSDLNFPISGIGHLKPVVRPLSSVFYFSLFLLWGRPIIIISWTESMGLRGLQGL